MLKDHRRRRQVKEFLAKIETALRARGDRILWGYVAADNRPARWTYGLRGYESVRRWRPHGAGGAGAAGSARSKH